MAETDGPAEDNKTENLPTKRTRISGNKQKRRTALARREPRSVGRPSPYSEDIVQTIVKAVELGNFAEPAAQAAGISRATYYKWLKHKPDFKTRIELAESRAELMLQSLVLSHTKKEWHAAKWIMGRRFRSRWADDAPMQINATGNVIIKSEDEEEKFDV